MYSERKGPDGELETTVLLRNVAASGKTLTRWAYKERDGVGSGRRPEFPPMLKDRGDGAAD